VQPSSIEVHLRDARELRELWLDGFENGGVFVEGTFLFTAGTPIRLRVTVDSPAASTVLDGTVVYRRAARGTATSGAHKPGIGIAFAKTLRPSIEFLSRVAKQAASDGRAHVRYPTDVEVELSTRVGEMAPARLVDVGVSGARVAARVPTELVTDRLVEFRAASAPSAASTSLFGRVVWSSADALGVRLVFGTTEERVHWAKLVTRARTTELLSARVSRVVPLTPPPMWDDQTPWGC
jgi:hypothetical protein